MEYSSKEMVIRPVKQVGQGVVKSITEDVGMKVKTGIHSLLVWITRTEHVHVLQGLKVMVSRHAKILMNAKRKEHVSAMNAVARIHGEAMSALVAVIDSILGTKMCA